MKSLSVFRTDELSEAEGESVSDEAIAGKEMFFLTFTVREHRENSVPGSLQATFQRI